MDETVTDIQVNSNEGNGAPYGPVHIEQTRQARARDCRQQASTR